MSKVTVKLHFVRATKNTLRYESAEGEAVETLYVRKDGIEGQPANLVLTIEGKA